MPKAGGWRTSGEEPGTWALQAGCLGRRAFALGLPWLPGWAQPISGGVVEAGDLGGAEGVAGYGGAYSDKWSGEEPCGGGQGSVGRRKWAQMQCV